MNKTSSVVSLVVILVIAIGAYFFPKGLLQVGPAGPQGPQGERGVGTPGRDGKDGVTTVRTVTVPATTPTPSPGPVLGSVTGPDSYFTYTANNDLRLYQNRTGLRTATTTVCSIKSPAATSTLTHGAVRFTVASTSATYIDLARATTPYATTTAITTGYTIAASSQGTVVASTTGSTAGEAGIFPPNTYFNVKVAWATAATSASVPTGVCQAVFTEI